ncbi:MAG: TIGR04551 family protein [Myxococcales bacterium]|nr:TIGR04551 family protein [Myxococcales bacterium]
MKRAASILALVLAAQAPAWAQSGGAEGAGEPEGAEGAETKAAEPAEADPEAGAAAEGEASPGPADDGQLDEAAAAKAAAEKAAAEKAAAEKAAAEKKANLERTTKPGAAVQGAPTVDELPAWDAEPTAGPDATKTPGHELTANWDVATAPEAEVAFPWIESHGYFRLRTDLFHNFDLDTYDAEQRRGSSPVLPPLTETDQQGSLHPEDLEHRYGRGADTQAGANIRFRYEPTFHITENLRVRGTFDILDNLVLGSTADGAPRSQFARPDVPISTFSGSARPPEAGVNGWRDSVRVKYLWGEWKTPVGLLMFGRTKSHWGLGLLANNGGCLDCDFGDAVDRIMGVTKLFGTYLALGWDFPAEGATGFSGQQNPYNQPFGQAYDFDQRDDVNQFVIALFQRPLTQLEKETRKRELNELRKPVFDWGVYNVIRTHPFEAHYTSGNLSPPDDRADYSLRDTKAFAYIPDVWLSYEIRPRKNKEYKLQFEGVGIFGVIEELPQRAGSAKVECLDPTVANIDDCDSGDLVRPRRRDLTQWGYALEFDARLDKLRWGFHHGIASGDDTDGFGILDKTPLDSTDPSDQEVTNFKFDRDYIVDLILFREIIGGVTNAAYYKPYIGYDLIMQDTEAWGFQLDVLFAHAMEPKATPGNEAPLGLEFDLELYVHEYDVFKWSLAYGILFPMGAFDLLDTEETRVIAEPGIAQTIQMMIGMMF